MAKTYMAVLVSEDGDRVTDFYGCYSVDEVQDKLNDMGSRWIFYPIHLIVRNNKNVPLMRKRVLSNPCKGMLVGTIIADIKNRWETVVRDNEEVLV